MPYKKGTFLKVGSSDYPLKLKNEHEGVGHIVDENSERFLLHKFTKIEGSRKKELEESGEDPGFKLHNLPKEFIENLYILNVIANSHLPTLAVRIAIALYYTLYDNDEGLVFITTSRKLNYDEVGEYGYIYIGRDEDGWEINDSNKLIELLKSEFGIETSSKELNNSLTILHLFHYITVTEVTPDNLYTEDKQRWNSANNRKYSKTNAYRANLKHISLNQLMKDKSLINWFISRKEGQDIRKKEKIDRGWI